MKTIRVLTNSRLFRYVLTGIIILFILRSGWTLLPECTLLPDFFSPWFAVAVFLALVYRIINAYGWTMVLRAMNQNVNGSQATRIWLLAESRRWLPGGVWGYASRAAQAQKMNVSVSVASASMLIELLLTIAAGIIVFLPVLFIYRGQLLSSIESLEQYSFSAWTVVIAAAVVVAMMMLCILLRRKLAKKFNSLKERLKHLHNVSLDMRRLLSALVFFVAMGWLNGLVTVCLLWSMPLTEFPPVAVVVAATSLSWVIGFFAIFAPGGLFVREATFAASMMLWMPYSAGLGVGILARVIQMIAELCGMLWVWFVGIETVAVLSILPTKSNESNSWRGCMNVDS